MPMQYPVYIQGMEAQRVSVQLPGMFTGPKLLVNGSPVMRGYAKNQYVLVLDSGQQVIAELKPGFVDPIPKMNINGYPIVIAPPFQWYEWIWACAPLVMIGIGGAIGGFLGAMAAVSNGLLLRSNLHPALRYLASGAVTLVSLLLFIAAVAALKTAIHSQ